MKNEKEKKSCYFLLKKREPFIYKKSVTLKLVAKQIPKMSSDRSYLKIIPQFSE